MGNAKMIPEKDALLLPYQAAWVHDRARIKLGEKSRQIGWSWCASYDESRKKSQVGARYDSWISSRDEIQAQLFLRDAQAFAGILNVAAEDLGLQVIDPEERHTAYVLKFATGVRINSMSSNPDAQAGKRGDRVLDEFALHKDPRKLYSIAYPGITISPGIIGPRFWPVLSGWGVTGYRFPMPPSSPGIVMGRSLKAESVLTTPTIGRSTAAPWPHWMASERWVRACGFLIEKKSRLPAFCCPTKVATVSR